MSPTFRPARACPASSDRCWPRTRCDSWASPSRSWSPKTPTRRPMPSRRSSSTTRCSTPSRASQRPPPTGLPRCSTRWAATLCSRGRSRPTSKPTSTPLPHTASLHLVNNRCAPTPIEANVCLADWAVSGLTVWASFQAPHHLRNTLCKYFGIPQDATRVITPDVGGGFGAKINFVSELFLAPALSRAISRPVKYTQTRSECLLLMYHGRAQEQDIEVAFDDDGKILALRLTVTQDNGAYPDPTGMGLPVLTTAMSQGCYKIPKLATAWRNVLTNTTPIAAYRGGGPSRGQLPDRAGHRPRGRRVRRRSSRRPPAQLHRRRRVPVRDPLAARRLRQRQLPGCARRAARARRLRGLEAGAGASAGDATTSRCSASASPPGWRSPASARPAPSRASGTSARGSRSRCASSRTARRSSTRAPRLTARAPSRPTPRSPPTSWASRSTTSPSGTATPRRSRRASARWARGPCRLAVRA